MTINVAVKSPGGIVLGTDSLVSASNADATLQALAHSHLKLFQLGGLPVGILLNGDVLIGGQSVEDVIAEFAEHQAAAFKKPTYDLATVVAGLNAFLAKKIEGRPKPDLELIVGGFSRKRSHVRCGEIYSISWPDGTCEELYRGDQTFGAHYGGRPDPIYRFIQGFDRFTAQRATYEWRSFFQQTRDFVIREIEEEGGTVPESVKEMEAPSFDDLPPWSMLSSYRLPADGEIPDQATMYRRIVEGSLRPYRPIFGFFSLPMAVNFTWYMLLLPYAESAYMGELPTVGSEIRVAVITRDEGFQRVWRGIPGISHELHHPAPFSMLR